MAAESNESKLGRRIEQAVPLAPEIPQSEGRFNLPPAPDQAASNVDVPPAAGESPPPDHVDVAATEKITKPMEAHTDPGKKLETLLDQDVTPFELLGGVNEAVEDHQASH